MITQKVNQASYTATSPDWVLLPGNMRRYVVLNVLYVLQSLLEVLLKCLKPIQICLTINIHLRSLCELPQPCFDILKPLTLRIYRIVQSK